VKGLERLSPSLKFIWISVVFGVGVTSVLRALWEQKPLGWIAFWRPWLPHLAIGLIALLLLTWVSHRARLRAQFAFVRCANKLRPEDLGFVTKRIGEQADTQDRPHYPPYRQRKFRELYSRGSADRVYKESDVISALEVGESVALFGPPVEGKTRTAYEILRTLKGWIVVMPKWGRPVPSEALGVFRWKRVVVLLDDLGTNAGKQPDLEELRDGLAKRARVVVTLATCRSGPALDTLGEETTAGQFFERHIPHKLKFVPMDTSEKIALKHDLALKVSDEQAETVPTPGALTMREPFEAMVSFREGCVRSSGRPDLGLL
jgi:hypothetical protein